MVAIVVLLAGAGAAWWILDGAAQRRVMPAALQTPLPAAPGKARSAGSAEGVRKCRKGSELIYTNGECPPGSRAEDLSGGTLSVLPAAPPTTPAPAASARTPLRSLADPEGAATLQEQRIEQATRR